MTDLHPCPIVLDASGADIPGEAARLRERGPLAPVVLPGGIRAWAITDPDVLKDLFCAWRVSKDAYRHELRPQIRQITTDLLDELAARHRHLRGRSVTVQTGGREAPFGHAAAEGIADGS